jgi:hypothetical protein
MLMLGSLGAAAAGTDEERLRNARTPVARPSYYDPFGEFFVQLDGFIYGLFLSQTHDSTTPIEINDLPLVSLGDDNPDAYAWLLQP